MIPVYYDEVNMVWKKADKTANDWYDYNNYKWANAVTVTSAIRATHNSSAVGTIISMTDINTMFVWIPRFKYRILAGTGPREIDVEFETKDTVKSTGNAVATYYTHPAFTADNTELSGIWVGKFETTGTLAEPTIKPDLFPITNSKAKQMYDSVKTNIQSNATFGFSNDSDAHMMKNMEWGAVTYLYHSKYGKFGNPLFAGANNEIYFNDSKAYYTGRSKGGPAEALVTYISEGNYTYDGKCARIDAVLTGCETGLVNKPLTDKSLAYGASTTGTIYGVYDMSGGTNEYVMGVFMPNPIPATEISDSSGFSSITSNSQFDLFNIDTKYYDRYLIRYNAMLGDATNEVAGWYGDYIYYVFAYQPWFFRGGYAHDGIAAGAFHFRTTVGSTSSSISFRVALWPQI